MLLRFFLAIFGISLCLYFFIRFKCVIRLADVSRALGLQVTRTTNSCLLHWRCQQPVPIFSLRNLIGFTGHNPWIDAPCIHVSNKNYNHVGGGSVVRTWIKRFAPSVVSGSNPVVAHMMATGGLHGR